MGKTDEQFAKLEGLIEELSVQADKSEVAREKSGKFMEVVAGIKLNSPENYEVYRKSLKEYFSSNLEYYRDKAAIIRTISPETANYIEKKIIEYEKILLKLIRDSEILQPKPSETNGERVVRLKDKLEDMEKTTKELPVKSALLDELIDLNHNFLQDILKFLRADGH